MRAELKGVKAFTANLKKAQNKLPTEVARALYQETSAELTEVKRRTPVKTGILRATEFVEGPFVEGQRIWTKIVAGGPAASYAAIVHENLEAFHKVGQAKYLESVIMESRPFMAARVAKRIEFNRLK